jgi:23S rRNA (uracil1939-C5)-methyltransferase
MLSQLLGKSVVRTIKKQLPHRCLSTTTDAPNFVKVHIDSFDLSLGGCGTGKLTGNLSNNQPTIVHVPNSVHGDICTVKDYGEKKKKRRRRRRGKRDTFEYRTLETLVSSSIHRIEPKCEHFEYCGGCSFQHIQYNEQLNLKEGWLRKEFLKAADSYHIHHKLLPPTVDYLPIIKCNDIYHYRNKMEFTFSPREFYQSVPQTTDLDLRPVLGLHPSRQTNSTKKRWHDKIVNINKCYLQKNESNYILNCIQKYIYNNNHIRLPVYDSIANEGFLRSVIIRTSHNNEDNNEVFLEFRTGVPIHSEWIEELELLKNHIIEKCSSFAASSINIVGICYTIDEQAKRHYEKRVQKDDNDERDVLQNIPTKTALKYGQNYYNETILGSNFQVSKGAFFQPNPKQSEILFSKTAELIQLNGDYNNSINNDEGICLWDLYCGSATVGISIISALNNNNNNRRHRLIGLDINPESVKDGQINAKLNGVDDFSFHAIDLNDKKKAMPLLMKLHSPDVIVVDPPRAGLHPQIIQVIRQIVKRKSMKVAYISCNPVTLARDIAMLCEGRDATLKPTIIQPIDMLPHTPHLETIVILETL